MMKKCLAVILGTLLLTGCICACSPQVEDEEALVQSSADTAEINGAAASEIREENSAQTTGSTPVLNSVHDLEGLKYSVDSGWTVTESGTVSTYAAPVAADLPLSITAAAMDAEDVASAQDAGLTVSEMLVSALGVESSGIESDTFKGTSCEKFEGIAESGYDAEGYIIPGDGWTYILMALSTNLDDDQVDDVWEAFLDSVELP